jgi:diphthamide biosynthesis methyltransferase
VYEPPRYMSVNTAVQQLLDIEENRREGGKLTTERAFALHSLRMIQTTLVVSFARTLTMSCGNSSCSEGTTDKEVEQRTCLSFASRA